MKEIKIRQATKSDMEAISTLFFETIQWVNIRDYSQEEVDDWSSWHMDFEKWEKKISEQYFIVAVLGGIVVGFASIAQDGYVDYMYTHRDFQSQGVATKMLTVLEDKARDQKNGLLYSEVSKTARSFFLSHGFTEESQQWKRSREKILVNYRMSKQLDFPGYGMKR